MHKTAWSFGVFHCGSEVSLFSDMMDRIHGSPYKMPLRGVRTQFFRILAKCRNAVMSWIDGMGQDFHRRVVFKVAGNGEQVFGHHGADGGTTGKKEVSYINLALECFIGYPVTVLV